MILAAQRLTLAPLTLDDAPDLYALMSDAEAMAFRDAVEITDAAAAADLLADRLAAVAEGVALHWALRRNDDGAFLGCCELSDIDRHHRRAATGFLVARAHWGADYELEAMHAVISHAAQALRLRRLSASAHLADHHAITVLQQLGFRREGVLRGAVVRDGERRDGLVMGLSL
ncbi:MAG: GNAT family protein [Caulobacteraceae bacterium]|nr:GNAT family protein [Caulobacteraceae bacterium]